MISKEPISILRRRVKGMALRGVPGEPPFRPFCRLPPARGRVEAGKRDHLPVLQLSSNSVLNSVGVVV